MQKQAPSLGRILTMVLFALSCFGLLLFLWVSFGGSIPLKPKPYEFRIAVPEATQLAQEADVRVAGVSIGKVVKKDLDQRYPDTTIATIDIDRKYAPIYKDAVAILRQKTLLGETYVEMTPGHKSAGSVPDGGLLNQCPKSDAQIGSCPFDHVHVKPTVELDEIFQAFPKNIRSAFQRWQQSLAPAIRGNTQNLNDVLGNLPAFASNGTDILRVLDIEQQNVSRLVRNTGVVFSALGRDQGALRRLILNSRGVFSETAQHQADIVRTFQAFPTFLDESKRTLARLKVFALDTDPLIRDLRPVARDLVPTLRDVRALAPDLRHLFANLDPLIRVSQTGLPALARVLHGVRPVLKQLGGFLEQLNPILQYLEQYQNMTAGFIDNGASGIAAHTTSLSGGTGHYLRQIGPVGAESIGFYRQRLSTNRSNPYLSPVSLQGPLLSKYLMFPNWDCNNDPVYKQKGAHGPVLDKGQTGNEPGCFVDKLPHITPGDTHRYPHIGPAHYPAR